MDLKAKVVVITGASKGLGRALAIAFARVGATVVVSARGRDGLAAVAQQIGAVAVPADVTRESEVAALARTVVERFGRIDVWVNNAGIWMPHAPIEEMDWDKVHQLMEVNLFGTIYGSKAALVQMRQQGTGIIVNVISGSALVGRPLSSGYCASKFAASGFTKSLRLAVEGSGISVVAVYPGGMKTGIFGHHPPADYATFMPVAPVAEKMVDNLCQATPNEELVIAGPEKLEN
ncbi:MAG: SDR family oxidoreductase [Candidatus Kerfeldbacteria bacterium]|nr:SDR family oxidoreductase [Candidatus Kerfeldbacteria bacterium]